MSDGSFRNCPPTKNVFTGQARKSVVKPVLISLNFVTMCFPNFLPTYIKERERCVWLLPVSGLLIKIQAEPSS